MLRTDPDRFNFDPHAKRNFSGCIMIKHSCNSKRDPFGGYRYLGTVPVYITIRIFLNNKNVCDLFHWEGAEGDEHVIPVQEAEHRRLDIYLWG